MRTQSVCVCIRVCVCVHARMDERKKEVEKPMFCVGGSVYARITGTDSFELKFFMSVCVSVFVRLQESRSVEPSLTSSLARSLALCTQFR